MTDTCVLESTMKKFFFLVLVDMPHAGQQKAGDRILVPDDSNQVSVLEG